HGLTQFGREVVVEMNRLGVLVDVSHASDDTFRDVIETSRAPVIASHSCCRTLCNAPRNLSNDQIRALADRGGVFHITFHNSFLSQEYADAVKALSPDDAFSEKAAKEKFGGNEARKLIGGQKKSDELIRSGKLPQVRWEKIVEHIDHAVQVAGADHVGLGSDFDGAFMPEGLRDTSQFPKITEGLLGLGYRESEIAGILGGNSLRVLDRAGTIGERLRSGKS
ncbi:MAG: dipeptidase, partial [Candidatus Acidiferrales bacterium]